MKPLVSVIMACYNKQAHIAETVRSVIQQTYADWELLIVDDCSTDDSINSVRQSFNDARVHIVTNPVNRGANYCRNQGLQLSKGTYLMFLDADDLLSNSCIEQRISAALKNEQANLLVFTMGVFYKTPGDDARLWLPTSKQPLDDFLQHQLPWSILQPFWKREFIMQLNGFDETFERLQDVELNTRALLQPNVKARLFPGSADCYYRIDESRKNFNQLVFMQRWVNATLLYCNKFFELVPANKKRLLCGTLFQTYLQLTLNYKTKQIGFADFRALEKKLTGHALIKNSVRKKALFKAAGFYNIKMPRVPGINFILKKMLML